MFRCTVHCKLELYIFRQTYPSKTTAVENSGENSAYYRSLDRVLYVFSPSPSKPAAGQRGAKSATHRIMQEHSSRKHYVRQFDAITIDAVRLQNKQKTTVLQAAHDRKFTSHSPRYIWRRGELGGGGGRNHASSVLYIFTRNTFIVVVSVRTTLKGVPRQVLLVNTQNTLRGSTITMPVPAPAHALAMSGAASC